MSKHLLNNLCIIIIISIICLYKSQNIITSWHYDKVQMYEIQKLGTIIETQIKEKVKTLPDFTEDSIKITNLNLTEVQQSLYDSYLNLKTGLLLLTPNKVTLGFTFSYEAEGASGAASFDLKINILKILISNNKAEQTQNVEVSMSSGEDDFSVYEITDKDLANKVKVALSKGFKNNDILNKEIAAKIDLISYYQDFYKNKRSLNFTTSEWLDSKKISVNFNRFIAFCEDIKGEINSALCYYSGELEEDKKDKSGAPVDNDEFVYPNGTYNTFINIDLYNSIVKKILGEGFSETVFNKNKAAKNIPYNFKVSDLKRYFGGLEKFDDSENFEIKIKINKMTAKSASFTASFKIGNQEDVFALEIELKEELKVEITKNVRINICKDAVTIKNINLLKGTLVIKDENGLKKAIEGSFGESLCLTDNGISLRDYYSIITKAYIKEEGIYLEGNQLYQ